MHSFSELLTQPLDGKVVLVRVDFNAPIRDGKVVDNTRLKASLGTIQSLTDKGAKVVLVTHLNRPGGKVVEAYRVLPIQRELEHLLGRPVFSVDQCIGPAVESAIANLNPADILLLENIRFYKEEEENEPVFAKTLAGYCDYFVQDAFGAVHRKHASTYGVATQLPSYSGQLLDKEIQYLSKVLTQPERPLTAIIGGAKISTKFAVLTTLLKSVDVMILGGAMVYTLLKAKGEPVGQSLVEDDLLDMARQFLEEATQLGKTVYIPEDHVVVSDIANPDSAKVTNTILDDQLGVDIGPVSIRKIQAYIDSSRCVFWNGPVGIFETPAYANGTVSIANHLANASAQTIVGGGDSIAAINQVGCADKMNHVSTGGGASLEYLEGKALPGITVLS